MTTLASIMLYAASAIFFGGFGAMSAKNEDRSQQLTVLCFSTIFFLMAAGLQVFG